jgi:hypothetical protein
VSLLDLLVVLTMSNTLCTFSGKYGDILWSLPTAKYISEKLVGAKVDFGIMPYYESLLPLLRAQPYIENAFVIKDWIRTHSNHGDQPWQPPFQQIGDTVRINAFLRHEGDQDIFEINSYDKAYHLSFKGHPGITAPSMQLIDFVAYQQGISFANYNPIPFLEAPDCFDQFNIVHLTSGRMTDVMREGRLIAYAFNEQYGEPKRQFFEALWSELKDEGVEFFNVAEAKWAEATYAIKMARMFVGCRSANWVVATGLGKETITYEPHPARNAFGHLGKIFGCSYGREWALPLNLPPQQVAKAVASVVRQKVAA